MNSSKSLPSQIPAAVLESPRRLVVQQVPIWPLESYGDSDLVLIEVKACGVCGSDFRYFLGENPWAQHTLGRFVPNAPNIVLGHEYAGFVVKVLHPKNEHLLGKRVAPLCFKVCGACEDCRAGRSRLCENTIHMGHGQGWGDQRFFPGAYSTHVPAWGASCFEIPETLPFEEAAMLDILGVCVHVAHQGRIQSGRPVLCIGAGPAGNGLAQAAVALGASQVVLLERSQVAIDMANRQGIGTVLDTSNVAQADVLATLKTIAPSGFGSVFDTVGTRESLDLGLSVLGKCGTLVNMAVHEQEIPLNFMRLSGERSIVTSCNFEVGDYPVALSWLVAGKFRVWDWLTTVALADLPGLFQKITDEPDAKAAFKLVVRP